MPYQSDAQRRYFNANRAQLEAQGVDVDEWNDSSRGKKLPERAKKKKTEKSAVYALAKLAAESQTLEPPSPTQSLIANTGTLGTQLGMQYGVKRYADAAMGKANSAFNRTLDPKDLLRMWSGLPPKDPALQGRPITDSWFNSPIHNTGKFDVNPVAGTATPVKDTAYSPQRLDRYRKIMALYGKNAPKVSPYTLDGVPAAYLHDLHTVWSNPGINDDAGHILAHELGHARQQKFLLNRGVRALRSAGQFATAYGGLAPLLRTDPDAARTDALVGTAGMLPTLGIEFDASLRGSNLMKRLAQQEGTWSKMKLLDKLKHRLGAFRGFPTYLAAASLPLASYGTRLGLGGYSKKIQKPEQSDFGTQIQTLVNKVRARLK